MSDPLKQFSGFSQKSDNELDETLTDMDNLCYRKDPIAIRTDEKRLQCDVLWRVCCENLKKADMHLKKNHKLQGGQSLSILFNYNTSEVVVSLSDSSDSLLVMVSTHSSQVCC